MGVFGMILRTLAEIAVIGSIIFGFMKESKLIRFEDKCFRFFRALRKKMRKARDEELRNELRKAEFAAEYETERRSKPARQARASEPKKRKQSRSNRVA